MLTKEEKSKMGSLSKRKGSYFEKVVREDLEKDGWIVFKNSNNVEKTDTENGQTILFKSSRPKYNPFMKRIIYTGQGFPDFLILKQLNQIVNGWEVQFCECKKAKYMSREEKERAKWITEKLHIPVYVAYPAKKRGGIIYEKV